jgi:hypothetical protein
LESRQSMVKDISKFELDRNNAKEYFFLNECKMSYIDHNGLTNSNKFRNFSFSESTLTLWTNEWLKPKIEEGLANNDDELLISLIEDYSDKIDADNSLLLIKLYNNLQNKIVWSKDKELNVLYHCEEPVLLEKKFEYGLIFITYKNKQYKEQKILFEKFIRINSSINKYDKKFITTLKKRLNC